MGTEFIPISENSRGYIDHVTSWYDRNSKVFFGEGIIEKVLNKLKSRNQYELPKSYRFCNKLTHEIYRNGEVFSVKTDRESAVNLIYVHGGAYIFDFSEVQAAFCDQMAEQCKATVYMPLYPLAPENSYEKAFLLLEELYETLRKDHRKMVLCGDSAGGGLVLAFVQKLIEEGKEIPDKLVLISPWLDVTMSNEKADQYEETDIMLKNYGLRKCGEAWAGNLAPNDRRISPFYGGVEGMPDTMLLTGTSEIMYPDIMDFYERLTGAGQKVQLICGEEMYHAFVLTPKLEEAKICRDKIASFIQE